MGVGLKSESRRYYPAGEVSAHIVGVTGIMGTARRCRAKLINGSLGKRTESFVKMRVRASLKIFL